MEQHRPEELDEQLEPPLTDNDAARWIPGLSRIFVLSAEELNRAKEAKNGLVVSLGIEEKFNLVLENYREFEAELLELTLRTMLFPHLKWTEFMIEIHLINRRLLNFLSAARLYRDHVRHDTSSLYGRTSEQYRILQSAESAQSSGKLGYRALEQVRNHVQHRALPVRELRYIAQSPDGEPATVHRIAPLLSVHQLREDSDFNKKVLRDLEDVQSKDGMVNVTPLVREMVEGIASIHDAVRRALEPFIRVWRDQIAALIEQAESQFGELHSGLLFVAKSEDADEVVQIFNDLAERRDLLIEKNSRLEKVSAQYVSGEARLDDSQPELREDS